MSQPFVADDNGVIKKTIWTNQNSEWVVYGRFSRWQKKLQPNKTVTIIIIIILILIMLIIIMVIAMGIHWCSAWSQDHNPVYGSNKCIDMLWAS